MSQTDYDIAIIGGGMVGASLANLLAAGGVGWRIAVLDTHSPGADVCAHYQPQYDNRSTAISAGSAEILERLGLWRRLREHCTPIRQVHVSDRGHLGGGLIDAAEQQREALGYVLENAWLAPCLSEAASAAPGVTYLAPVMVEALTPGAESTRLQLQGGPGQISARLVVLADGGASSLRQDLGIGIERRDYRQSAIVANLSYERRHGGQAFERFTPEGPMALLPLDERPEARRSALVWTLPPERARALMQAPDDEFMAQLQAVFGWRLGRFLRVGERQCWPLELVQAKEQIRSRLVLLGNSAHYLHPVAGQGFNLSLRDAAALAATLRPAQEAGEDPGNQAVLQSYLDQRENDQTLTVGLSDRLVRLFSNRSLPLTALRHLGFLGLDWLPGMKALFAAQTMGTAGPRAPWEASGLMPLDSFGSHGSQGSPDSQEPLRDD
ncbi:2-octaprenyl-6-methoxyphenyl hydroxylase [Marinimicrobium sp. C2-29]|uniref:2-octaprenyl-6-methoxyphenyl hydroxylase n=1 Tax=Marinimicrobium sp. C2-29 TaxID=3139825 RepID=UPI00313899E7